MYRVSIEVIATRVEVWENEKCCGKTKRQARVSTALQVLRNFNECFYLKSLFLSRNYRLIFVPRKFDVLKINICQRSERFEVKYARFKNIKFLRDNFPTDSFETSILLSLSFTANLLPPHPSSKIKLNYFQLFLGGSRESQM